MRIENPFESEQYWMVSRVAIVEEHYFDNEEEARDFAATKPYYYRVDPPVKKAEGCDD